MALRALASKIRIPAALRRSPASRPIAPPQDTVGSTSPPKLSQRGLSPLDEKLLEQQYLAFEKKLIRDMYKSHFVGSILGISSGSFIVYLLFRPDE